AAALPPWPAPTRENEEWAARRASGLQLRPLARFRGARAQGPANSQCAVATLPPGNKARRDVPGCQFRCARAVRSASPKSLLTRSPGEQARRTPPRRVAKDQKWSG